MFFSLDALLKNCFWGQVAIPIRSAVEGNVNGVVTSTKQLRSVIKDVGPPDG